ncbi:hypothetical protein AB6A40_002532 [Gnathostoma spinigerum]|uniref:Phospholipid/glycerol acyltransferase domain-containing protein n=1 Tax=Gnathostoma spinigerum TaxID=75299 RepID=A0ABD6EFX1_9BILA
MLVFNAAIMGRAKCILFVFLLFITSLLGSIFILAPFTPLIYFSPRLWRAYADTFVAIWLTLPASVCDLFFGVEIFVTGDLIDRHHAAIMLMNHRTRLDWLFFWNVLYKMDPWLLTTEKIALKAPLKHIPGAGWAMSCGSFLFLERRFESDKEVMNKIVKYYKDMDFRYQILFFPEGTDRGPHAVRISDDFAAKNGLPKYDYVLHPRTSGFFHLLQLTRKGNYIKYVYDITVAYPDRIISSEKELLVTGEFPKAIHFDVQKYDVRDLPIDETEIEHWLRRKWFEKERKLRLFYEKEPNKRRFIPKLGQYTWPVRSTEIGYYLSFAFWTLSSIVWIYLTYHSFCFLCFVILSSIFFVLCQFRFKGFEFFVIEMFRRRMERKQCF